MSLKSAIRRFAPRSIRAHRILGGQLRGRIIVTSLHDYPAAIFGRTERRLLEWFRKNVKPGETWLDIGAHYGYTSIALAELVGPSGQVYAFEPSIRTAGCLSQTRELNGLNQITVMPFGLGKPGDIRLMSVPIERGMANHEFGGDSTQDILVIGFDDLWAALGRRPVSGVKIDVQGMEVEVLEGMTRTLIAQRPHLVVEVHAGVDRARIAELLGNAGYHLPATPLQPETTGHKTVQYADQSYVFTPTSDSATLLSGAQTD